MALPNSSLAFTSQVLKNHEDLVWSSLPRIRMRLPVMSCLVLLEQTVQTRNSVQETSFFLWINAFDGGPQKFGPILMYPTIRKENLFPTNHHPAIPCYTMLYHAISSSFKRWPKKDPSVIPLWLVFLVTCFLATLGETGLLLLLHAAPDLLQLWRIFWQG